MSRATNWAGNVSFGAKRLHQPTSVEQLQEFVAGGKRIRALGTGHSFNGIADTTGDLISLQDLPATIELDPRRGSVTVAAGVRYGELAQRLHAGNRALPNLGSLPHISVAGACATGTHGSGDTNGNLATAVSAMDLVTASGESVTLSRDVYADAFCGAVVGLGCVGIVTHLTLDTVPAFDIAQYVYDDLPAEQLTDDFETLFSSAYSVSVFTDWRGQDINQVWLKQRTDAANGWEPEPHWRGATLADGGRHPVPGMSPIHCTQQGGVPGPWHERLPHFRLHFTPSSGNELQSEYLLPRQAAADAISALYSLG
ncbi:MAG: FAD-binding protein, partial [Nocardioidaceae bacterium]